MTVGNYKIRVKDCVLLLKICYVFIVLYCIVLLIAQKLDDGQGFDSQGNQERIKCAP